MFKSGLSAAVIICAATIVSACATVLPQPTEPIHLFNQNENGYAGFRIPSICKLPNGTLLAFAEGRVANLGDAGNVDLVMRRSTDGGKTWEPMVVLGDDGSNFLGNSAPVVDEKTGTVTVLLAWKSHDAHEDQVRAGKKPPTQIWRIRSVDGGKTWTQPAPVESLKFLTTQRKWLWNLPSPCHGIQLQRGRHAGRFIVAGNHSATGGNGNAYLGAHVLYSDDAGLTWNLGAFDQAPAGGRQGKVVYPNESTVAERADGSLLFHTRDHGGPAPGNRGYAISKDAGKSFDPAFQPLPGMVGPVCQGSLLAGLTAGGKPVLLASLPGDPAQRKQLLIRISTDDGKTWRNGPVLYPGDAAYSDLVMTAPGKFLALAELDNYKRITILPFTLP